MQLSTVYIVAICFLFLTRHGVAHLFTLTKSSKKRTPSVVETEVAQRFIFSFIENK